MSFVKRGFYISFIFFISFILVNVSFAEFKVSEVQLEDSPGDETERIEELEEDLEKEKNNKKVERITKTKKIYKTEPSDVEKIKALEEENKKLKKDLDALELKLEKMIKLIDKDDENKEDTVLNIDTYPLQETLNNKMITSLTYQEPVNTNPTLLWVNRDNIYNSRISKSALQIMIRGEDSIKISMKDLNISIRQWLKIPTDSIAYKEYIEILGYYLEDGTLDYVIVKRRGDLE